MRLGGRGRKEGRSEVRREGGKGREEEGKGDSPSS